MNVFVLNPGRCGSLTFFKACQHITNFSCGHETKTSHHGQERFVFPENHIEIDNRLSWFLGSLARNYDDRDVFYVKLVRDSEKIAKSWLKRWNTINFSLTMIKHFAHGVIMRSDAYTEDQMLDVCHYYVQTVYDNIDEFIKTRRHMTVFLEDGGHTFSKFLTEINASGDLDFARKTWGIVHNQS